MSGTAEAARVYASLEDSARLLGVPCSRDRVWPILTAYEDALQQASIALRVATDAGHAGDLNCHLMMLPKDVDPYAVALAEGAVAATDHPVGALLADIAARCPVEGYGIDLAVAGGFQKVWAIFPPHDMQRLSTLAGVPSMPHALAGNLGVFASRGLDDKACLVGIDYRHRTANVYFGELPGSCLEPDAVRSMHREIGLPEPSERLLALAGQAFGFYATFGWDSPRIQRISFSIMAPDPAALPVRLEPAIERFLESVPHSAGSPVLVYVAMSPGDGEYYKAATYYRWQPRLLKPMRLADRA